MIEFVEFILSLLLASIICFTVMVGTHELIIHLVLHLFGLDSCDEASNDNFMKDGE